MLRITANSGPGCQDTPGHAHLPAISQLLWVGNEVSAACGTLDGPFETVISTVVPRRLSGSKAPELTTHAVMFEDGRGSETSAKKELARERILEGASMVADALSKGRRTLVHCAWGQNRSGTICCAYAVLYAGMSADAAIEYVRKQNRAQRTYRGQVGPGAGPMHNAIFNELLRDIEMERTSLASSQLASSPIWEVVGGSNKGGIVVRAGKAVTSPLEPERLSCGALVRELHLDGLRLQYERLTGMGPKYGWVSLRLAGGKPLLMISNETALPLAELVPAEVAKATTREASRVAPSPETENVFKPNQKIAFKS